MVNKREQRPFINNTSNHNHNISCDGMITVVTEITHS